MPVSIESLHEYMRIYKEDTGEDITEDEAREITSRLLRLYTLLSKPLPSEQSDQAASE